MAEGPLGSIVMVISTLIAVVMASNIIPRSLHTRLCIQGFIAAANIPRRQPLFHLHFVGKEKQASERNLGKVQSQCLGTQDRWTPE